MKKKDKLVRKKNGEGNIVFGFQKKKQGEKKKKMNSERTGENRELKGERERVIILAAISMWLPKISPTL